MKKQLAFTKLAIIVVVLLLISNCKKGEENLSPSSPSPTINTTIPQNNYTPPAITFSAVVQGFVIDEQGNEVSNATIKAGNKTTTTDINGYFRIDKADFTGDFCYIKATKQGFFTSSTTVHGKAGKEYAAELVMQPLNTLATFSSTQVETVNVQGGGVIELPANGYITSTGATYTGNVNVAVVHINPEADNFSNLIPGGDLRAFDANGNNMVLYSYGMLNVELRDDAGNLLQLGNNKKATLTFPVTPSQQGTAPSTIPLWYFDEYKGIWIEEGEATIQGNTYVGEVNHFTPWNIDIPVPPSIAIGKIVDKDNTPQANVKLKAGQRVFYTLSDGTFRAFVLPDSDFILDLFDNETNKRLGINKAFRSLGENQTLDLGTIVMEAPNKADIVATIKKCDGTNFNGYVIINNLGAKQKIIVNNSKLHFKSTASGKDVVLTAYSSDFKDFVKKTITLPSSSSEVRDLGEIKVCSNTENINFLEFTYIEEGKEPVHVKEIQPIMADLIYLANQSTPLSNIQISDGLNNISQTYRLALAFNFKKAGNYILTNAQDPNNEGVMILEFFDEGLRIVSDQVELVLDNYSSIGETSTGTFSGTAKILGGPQRNVTIKDGKFRVTRVADR